MKKNAGKLTNTSFSYDFGAEDTNEHTIQVDAYYTVKAESVKGGITKFILGVSGIEETTTGKIEMQKGENEITVTGNNVSGVEIISANGAKVAGAKGNTVSLDGIQTGTYIVKAVADGKTVTRKVVISK